MTRRLVLPDPMSHVTVVERPRPWDWSRDDPEYADDECPPWGVERPRVSDGWTW